MAFGLPEDDGITIPTYPPLGFISVEEVADALARPLTLFRRRRRPFRAVRAIEADAAPIANAIARSLNLAHPPAEPTPGQAPRERHPTLYVSIAGRDLDAIRRIAADPDAWVFCLGLAHPLWMYADSIDGVLVPSEVEVPWVARDSRARPPSGNADDALAAAMNALVADPATISDHLAWHETRRGLRAGDPVHDYAPWAVC